MPELPEVETMVDRLQKYVGMEVTKVTPAEGQDPERYAEATFSCTERLKGVFRRGKFMVFMLDDCALLAHNAMSGYWDELDDPWTFDYVEGGRQSGASDVRALVELVDGDGKAHRLQFHDARKFGSLRVVAPEELAEKLSKLGPEADHTTWMYEPSEVMTPVKFVALLESSGKPVKELLMDQGKIAGVGNIYASEACWHARVNPLRPASNLGEEEQLALFISIRSVIRQALERRLDYGGLKIYRREKCPKCGERTATQKLKGRTTYWCQRCQR